MVYIETPRLLLRDWKEEDFVVFSEMNSSPSVMKYFLHPLSEEESLVLLMLSGVIFSDMVMGDMLWNKSRTGLLSALQAFIIFVRC